MRVLLDASYARARPRSGTGVYIERLAGALRAEGVEVEEVAAPRPRRYLSPHHLAWTGVSLARHSRGFDVLHHPLPALARGAGLPQVITVHDLAFLEVPECFNRRFRMAASVRHRAAARAAAAIVTPTAATAGGVAARWGVPERRIHVAPHGPGQIIGSDRGEPRHFLYVGDAEPRKNLPRLRAAHELYRARGGTLPLVLAGAAGAPASEAQLAALHRHAAALVIPSLHEGFGLPALEAMHAGTPVLAARIPALTEVCGDAARYCDPRDPASIAAALEELAGVGPLREELRRRGIARATAFTWERSARCHVTAYESALRGSPRQ